MASSAQGGSPPTPAVSDALDQLGLEAGAVAQDLPLHLGSGVFAGPAHVATIVDAPEPSSERIPGYSDCIDAAPDGAVMVLAWAASVRVAVLGDSAATRAQRAGVAGVVVDGWIRDVEEIGRLGLPALARGTTPVSGRRRVRVSRDTTEVQIGGMTIRDGDWVVADANGVCVVPAERRDEVVALAAAIEERDTRNAGSGF